MLIGDFTFQAQVTVVHVDIKLHVDPEPFARHQIHCAIIDDECICTGDMNERHIQNQAQYVLTSF